MKKSYYLLPFVLVPTSMLLCELLDRAGLLKMNVFILGAIMFALSALLGYFAHSPKKIGAMMPLSLFATMFAAGLLDETETYARFTLRVAVKVSTQPAALILYALMALTALLFSFAGGKGRRP